MEKDYSEKALLSLIDKFVSSQKGRNIQEKLANYLKNSKSDKSKQEIFKAITFFVENNEIVADELLGFKNNFVKIFIDLLSDNKYYKKKELDKSFLSIDQKIKKRMKFTLLLWNTNCFIYYYKTFFFMLNRQKFKEFKQLYNDSLQFPFDTFEEFNNKIDLIDEKEIDKLCKDNSDVPLLEEKINGLLASFSEVENYIEGSQSLNSSSKKENIKKKKKNIKIKYMIMMK